MKVFKITAGSGAVGLAVDEGMHKASSVDDVTPLNSQTKLVHFGGTILIGFDSSLGPTCRLINQSLSIRPWHHLGLKVTAKSEMDRAMSMITFQLGP